MSETPTILGYAKTHEWAASADDGAILVGISDHAQDSLGDVVYVELPEVGRVVAQGEEVAVVESVKAASDIYAPVAGEIVAVNKLLEDAPETLNQSPLGDGWMFRLKISDPAELESLLDAEGYNTLVTTE